jgi:hypothetical protein
VPAPGGVVTSIADVVEVHRNWLHLPDPGIVEVTFGAVAANRLPGDPVWLLNVGASSSGKTETLGAASRLPDVHPTATLTEAALLSGTPKKEHATGAKGGLLREVGEFGIIVAKDFTSLLSMNRDSRTALLAALREVYDGAWTRHVGTGGGVTLHWEGKVGFIGGCTPTIDGHHAVSASMGERLIYYRLPEPDDEAQGHRALAHVGRERQMRDELAEAVVALFAGIDGWHLPPRPLSTEERTKLVDLASLAARARSAVERDRQSREVELVPGHEAPGRLVKVLAQLLAGMEVIGVLHAEVWRLLGEVAMGCMPALRRSVLECLAERETWCPTTEVALAVDYPTNTVRRTLEDLTAHGTVRRSPGGQGKADRWELTEWTWCRWPSGTVPASPEPSISYSELIEEGIAEKVADLDEVVAW